MSRSKNPAGQATINEIAEACGVSVSTVSRALCNRPRVAAEVREKILAEAQKRNYKSGGYKRQGKLLILAGDKEFFINGVYFHDMINSLSERFSRIGTTILVAPDRALTHLGELYFDGAVSLSENAEIPREWEKRYNLPLILLNIKAPFFSENFYTIQTDEQEIMNRIFDMLIAHHHERIGMLLTGSDNLSNRARESHFREAAKARRLSSSCFVEKDYEQDYFNALGQLIRQGITALVCPSESQWYRITHALWLYKINVPEQLSLVVWEGAAPMEYHTPPLTAVRQNYSEFAEHCFHIIQQRMLGEFPRQAYSVRSSLMERESVRTL